MRHLSSRKFAAVLTATLTLTLLFNNSMLLAQGPPNCFGAFWSITNPTNNSQHKEFNDMTCQGTGLLLSAYSVEVHYVGGGGGMKGCSGNTDLFCGWTCTVGKPTGGWPRGTGTVELWVGGVKKDFHAVTFVAQCL